MLTEAAALFVVGSGSGWVFVCWRLKLCLSYVVTSVAAFLSLVAALTEVATVIVALCFLYVGVCDFVVSSGGDCGILVLAG